MPLLLRLTGEHGQQRSALFGLEQRQCVSTLTFRKCCDHRGKFRIFRARDQVTQNLDMTQLQCADDGLFQTLGSAAVEVKAQLV